MVFSNVQLVSLSYLESMPLTDAEQKAPVLFLHSEAFTSAIWEETGTLQLVASLGHRAVAVDLPGFGGSSRLSTQGVMTHWLAQVMQELRLVIPVLVAPSTSGLYALSYIMNDAPSTPTSSSSSSAALALALPATWRLRGLVVIGLELSPSTSSTEEIFMYTHSVKAFERLSLLVLYVYGAIPHDPDTHVKHSVDLFGHVSGVEIQQIQDAGHACYVEQPERWHSLLRTFLQRV